MATLTGNARTIITAPAGAIPFSVKALFTPYLVDGRIIISGERRYVTASDGAFSMVLGAGNYEVTFNGVDKFTISVPNDEQTYPFIDRLTSTVTQPSPAPGGSSWPTFPAGSDWIVTSDGRLIGKSRSSGRFHQAYLTGSTDEVIMVIQTPGTLTP